jgi:ribosome recycling factor
MASTDDPLAAEQQMGRAVSALERDLERVRAGGASASMLDGIHVDHQGRRARLLDAATITIPDPRQIVIRPWDPAALRAVGAAVSASRTGLTPKIDGPLIRLYVPTMTAERRRELIEVVHRRLDQARVEVRAIRHAALATTRAAGHERSVGGDEVRRRTARLQVLTDRSIAEIDRLGRDKEASILRP